MRASPGRGRDTLQGSLQGTEKGGKQPAAGDGSPGPGSPRGGPGGLLAFALSLDEIIVTTFTLKTTGAPTLPIWIFENISRPNQLPIVYAVCLIVMILSAIPVYFATRIAGDATVTGRA